MPFVSNQSTRLGVVGATLKGLYFGYIFDKNLIKILDLSRFQIETFNATSAMLSDTLTRRVN